MRPVFLGLAEMKVSKKYPAAFRRNGKTEVWEMRVVEITRQETRGDGSQVIRGLGEPVKLLETISDEEWENRCAKLGK